MYQAWKWRILLCMTRATTWRLGHRPALDGIRGLAVLLVVADHGGLLWRGTGSLGVIVFFVLSGFLITRVIVEAQAEGTWSLRRFYAARAVRLAPALVAMVGVLTVVLLASGEPNVLGRAARALSYTENFFTGVDAESPFNHAWSLAVEEQFYLLWPLVVGALAGRRHRLLIVGVLVVVSVVAREWLFWEGHGGVAYSSLPTNAFALLLGCGIALRSRPASVGAVGLLGAGIGFIACVASLGTPIPGIEVLAAVFAAVFVAGSGGAAARVFSWSPLRFFGRISYALYLWHYPVLMVTGGMYLGPRVWLVLPATVLIATASTLWLEEPIRRAWRRRSGGVVVGVDARGGEGVVVDRDLVDASRERFAGPVA
jgi:peptidoglycan/LPS O-acetylase OafA/YrhL